MTHTRTVPWRRGRTAVIVGLLWLGLADIAWMQSDTFRLPKGQSKEAWFGINVAGKLHYSVRTRDNSNRVRAHWRTWGFGTEREAGMLAGDGEIEIPISLWRGVISARLRIEAVDDAVVAIRENAKVAHSVTFDWPD